MRRPGSSRIDTSRVGWLALLVVALAVRELLARHTTLYDVQVQQGFVSLIIAGIVAAAQWLASNAATVAVTIWEVLQKVGVIIWEFAIKVGDVFVQVYKFFGRFWSSVLQPFIKWSWSEILQVKGWLERTVGPVLKYLQLVRTRLLSFYTKWFRPIFDTIDAVRGTLNVLSTLHVKFAKELDDKLTALENRMLDPIRLALTKLNEAMNWINRIVTVDGLFQRLTLLASLWQHVGDVWSVLLSHNPEGTDAGAIAAAAAQTYPADDPAIYVQALNDWYDSQSGLLAPLISDMLAIEQTLTT